MVSKDDNIFILNPFRSLERLLINHLYFSLSGEIYTCQRLSTQISARVLCIQYWSS